MPGNDHKAIEPEKRVLYRKASDYCAQQDRCSFEIALKLKKWGADAVTTREIVCFLEKESFIDEQRYASNFARGKFRNLQWGRIKIRFELQAHKISLSSISKALAAIDTDEYLATLHELATKKIKSLGGDNLENRLKTMRFLAGKGFEPELIRTILNT